MSSIGLGLEKLTSYQIQSRSAYPQDGMWLLPALLQGLPKVMCPESSSWSL